MSCRVGGILAPFVPSMRDLHTSMPFMVFCLSGISAGCLGLLLPETLNKPVTETLDELSSSAYHRIVETETHLFEEDQSKTNHNQWLTLWTREQSEAIRQERLSKPVPTHKCFLTRDPMCSVSMVKQGRVMLWWMVVHFYRDQHTCLQCFRVILFLSLYVCDTFCTLQWKSLFSCSEFIK